MPLKSNTFISSMSLELVIITYLIIGGNYRGTNGYDCIIAKGDFVLPLILNSSWEQDRLGILNSMMADITNVPEPSSTDVLEVHRFWYTWTIRNNPKLIRESLMNYAERM